MARDAHDAVEVALEAIAAREQTLHAFAHLDEKIAHARAARAPSGPLFGITLGVKDIFDTVDLATEHGSPIYAGNQPCADAGAVALLAAAGALVIGKTVTTELAWFTPGPTTNPHRPSHTPGGSSSGSAAAVGARTIDLALGTQTAGSVIRPASYCGVYGYKPTFGIAPTAGVKQAAPSLDTVGLFAADLTVLDRARVVLTGRTPAPLGRPLRFGFVRTEQWPHLANDARRAVEDAAERVEASERELPRAFVALADDQAVVQAYEGARALAYERTEHRGELSTGLCAILDHGATIGADDYDAAMARRDAARGHEAIEELFGETDVLLVPAATGEAPEGLDSTGDPRCCRTWTLLGLPALCVPGLSGATGLPIGIQLVARSLDDDVLLGAGAILADALAR